WNGGGGGAAGEQVDGVRLAVAVGRVDGADQLRDGPGIVQGRVDLQVEGRRGQPILQVLQARLESGRRLADGARRAGSEQVAKPGTVGHGKSPTRQSGFAAQ